MKIQVKYWTLLGLASAGCGEVAAKPIEKDSSQAVTTVSDGTTTAEDPYACVVVQVAPLYGAPRPEHDPQPFFDGAGGGSSGPSLGGKCSNPAAGAEDTCMYAAAPRGCTDTLSCGGWVAQHDATNDTFTVHGTASMTCAYPCKFNQDCPAPASGTAPAACNVSPAFDAVPDVTGDCILRCDHGEACPDGFDCVDQDVSAQAPDGTTWTQPASCVQHKTFSAQYTSAK